MYEGCYVLVSAGTQGSKRYWIPGLGVTLKSLSFVQSSFFFLAFYILHSLCTLLRAKKYGTHICLVEHETLDRGKGNAMLKL